MKRLKLFENAAHEILDALAAEKVARKVETIMAHLIKASRAPTDTSGDYLRQEA